MNNDTSYCLIFLPWKIQLFYKNVTYVNITNSNVLNDLYFKFFSYNFLYNESSRSVPYENALKSSVDFESMKGFWDQEVRELFT